MDLNVGVGEGKVKPSAQIIKKRIHVFKYGEFDLYGGYVENGRVMTTENTYLAKALFSCRQAARH